MVIPGYIKTVFISLLIIIIIFVMVMAKPILVPLLLSSYIAMLLTPFCNRLEKFKIPRSLAAFVALMLMSVILASVVWFIVSQLKNFSADLQGGLAQKLNDLAAKADTFCQQKIGFDLHMENGFDLSKIMALLQKDNNELGFVISAIGTLSNVILLPVFVFFLLIYRDHFAHFLTKVFAKQRNSDLLKQMVSIREVVHSYLTGAGKVMLILGVVNTGVLFALGIKHAIFFGMLAGFLNIIPYIGPGLGATLPFFFALVTKDSLFYPIAIATSFTIIQFLESAYLTPKITGANVNLNAFITFLGLLIGGAIWGIVGMILIIPTIAILKKLFELSPETEPYAYLFGEEDLRWFKRYKNKT